MCVGPPANSGAAVVTAMHKDVVEHVMPASTGITVDLTISRMGTDTFLQAYDGKLGTLPQYLGVQSTAPEWTAIWSVFDITDAADLDPYDGSTGVTGVDTKGDGTYVSIHFPVTRATHYVLSVAPVADGWEQFSVDGHAVGEIYVEGRPTFATTGSAWAEYWPDNYAAHPITPPPVTASVLVRGTK
jgi:hypothetical protein